MAGVDVNACDIDQKSALYIAASKRDVDFMKEFLQKKMDISGRVWDWTTLYYAVDRRFLLNVSIILNADSDFNVDDMTQVSSRQYNLKLHEWIEALTIINANVVYKDHIRCRNWVKLSFPNLGSRSRLSREEMDILWGADSSISRSFEDYPRPRPRSLRKSLQDIFVEEEFLRLL